MSAWYALSEVNRQFRRVIISPVQTYTKPVSIIVYRVSRVLIECQYVALPPKALGRTDARHEGYFTFLPTVLRGFVVFIVIQISCR